LSVIGRGLWPLTTLIATKIFSRATRRLLESYEGSQRNCANIAVAAAEPCTKEIGRIAHPGPLTQALCVHGELAQQAVRRSSARAGLHEQPRGALRIGRARRVESRVGSSQRRRWKSSKRRRRLDARLRVAGSLSRDTYAETAAAPLDGWCTASRRLENTHHRQACCGSSTTGIGTSRLGGNRCR